MQADKLSKVDQYILGFPKETQQVLSKIRTIIKKLVPDAEEGLAYGMPSYKTYKRPLLYFAGYANHIGFYATPAGHEEFKKELSIYKQGKGSVQFPLNKPIPYDLIKRIVEFRALENQIKYQIND